MKIYKLIIIIIFFLIIITPMLFINIKPKQISLIDNIILPESDTIKNYNSFSNYISKRIGFRENMINFYTNTNYVLFNNVIHPLYEVGQNGYIFSRSSIEIHDDEWMNKFVNYLKQMQNYFESNNTYFCIVIHPTKKSVYYDYLPLGYNYTDYRFNNLKKLFNENEIHYIDTTETLIEHSKTEQVFDQKYDAGHWNDIGAFYAFQYIFNTINTTLNLNINSLELSNYTIKSNFKPIIPTSNIIINEKIPELMLTDPNYTTSNKFNSLLDPNSNTIYSLDSANSYYYESENNDETLPSLLFFRGSYSNNKEKFICPILGKTYLVHNYKNVLKYKEYYELFEHPDIVLLELVEYSTYNSYFPIE